MAKRPSSDDLPSPIKAALESLKATRRSVVAMLLAAAGVSVAAKRSFGANLIARPLPAPVPAARRSVFNGQPLLRLRTRVIRPDDFLYLDIEFENLITTGGGSGLLQRADPGKPGFMIVHHQPQAIADQAYPNQQPDPTPNPPAVADARMAGESRVVFVMPAGVPSIPYTLPSMLKAFRTWPMSLDNTAGPDPNAVLTDASLVAFTNGLFAHFVNISDVLNANVSADQQAALKGVLDTTFATVKTQVANSVAVHRLFSGAQIDALIAKEFQKNLQTVGRQPSLQLRNQLQTAPSRQLTVREFMALNNRMPRPGEDLSAPAQNNQLPTTTLRPLALSPTTEAGLPLITLIPILAKPHEPPVTVTAIEIPYRLIQSPLATAGWDHQDLPRTHGKLTELWHTRLGTRTPGGVNDRSPEPIRAIWSPDYPLDPPPSPFTMTLTGVDRQMLVKLTAGYNETTGGGNRILAGPTLPYVPKPAIAKRLMLTALGGWLVEDGDWTILPDGVDLTQWNQRTAMARDYYVRVVYAGMFFPFGNAASLVKVSERKFQDQPDKQGRVAILRQRFYLIVRERTRIYEGAEGRPFAGNDFPFTRIDILNQVSPEIAPPGSNPADRLDDGFYSTPDLYREAFWPVLPGNPLPGQAQDFQFQMVGYDHAGKAIPFTAPLFFLSINRNNPDSLTAIAENYAKAENLTRRQRPFNGAVIQFAPQADDGGQPGDTNIPTDSITFLGANATAPVPETPVNSYPPQFYPGTESAAIRLPAVQRLLGSNDPVTARVSQTYKDNGFGGANPSGVFLDLLDAASTLAPGQPSDKGGGLVTPAMTPTALSRSFGAVSGANNAEALLSGNFNPKDFLPDLKLLGVIPISEVLPDILPLDKAPKLTNIELPEKLETTFSIHQDQLQPWPVGSDKPIFVPDADGKQSVLDITALITVERHGAAPPAAPKSQVDGSVNNFKINLFGCIIITFDELSFHARPGQKPDVQIGFNTDHGVLFGGPLEFVNELKKYIPANGFSDPPNLAVTPAGITASYSLALPAITVGVLTLQNITIGAGFDLPFDGKPPSARFNFAERHNPFNLTVSLFGGGGFLAISVSTKGVQEIEAQLEFGAYAAIDLGVASGAVYIKGGFYFHWQAAKNEVELEAFVELGGHLSVIGLITVSLTFHVGLHYIVEGNNSSLVGQATLTVEVEVLFFSTSVDVSVEKRFAGSKADPRFIDFIPDTQTWQNYCAAFG